MVNSNSAVALYGFQDIPLNLEAQTNDLGIKLLLVPQFIKQKELGSQALELVNRTAALFIYEIDNELNLLIQFYLTANKPVFFITEEETEYLLPKGVQSISTVEDALKILLQETEKSIIKSQIGNLEIRFNSFGLTHLKLSKQNAELVKPSKQLDKVSHQLDEYFNGQRKNFNLKVCLKGTDFQRKVWTELTHIPYGHTLSYGELAQKVGDSNASRAVGLAISKNPIWIFVPCHRVLSKEGDLTGYAGGLKLKQFLLDIESKQTSLF
ncbi:MAG: methylated-DNA--[protein]-cysteine S-methyltransferase [Bacteroidales bacterium]|nr:methylated-DNA--[protein]-cysteine S-methyltransferase [Bacteroidales bacterium]